MTADARANYVAAAPAPLGPLLEDVRAALASALPDADEIMMYGMPGFAIEGVVVAGYAAFGADMGKGAFRAAACLGTFRSAARRACKLS